MLIIQRALNSTHPSILPPFPTHRRHASCPRNFLSMAISDAIVANLTIIYLLVIAAIKAYGLALGRSFSGACVLVFSTAVVAAILIASLTWDVSRKATHALIARDHAHEMCRGGICWHGVAVKSPASQVRFRLPHHHHHNA